MDKIEQLYNLYLQKGLITDKTTLDMFRGADSGVQQKLYDIGKQKGLFNTTDVATFQSAWTPTQDGVKKKEPSQTFVGVGSKDYSPNAPVNPITANIASAKKAASTPVAPTEKVVGEFEIDVPAPTGMYETIERTSPNSKKSN